MRLFIVAIILGLLEVHKVNEYGHVIAIAAGVGVLVAVAQDIRELNRECKWH